MEKIKKVTLAMTPGIADLINDKNDESFTSSHVEGLFKIALYRSEESYFISFKSNGIHTLVTDGNGNELSLISFPIPENIWMIQDMNSEDEISIVAMLPSEY